MDCELRGLGITGVSAQSPKQQAKPLHGELQSIRSPGRAVESKDASESEEALEPPREEKSVNNEETVNDAAEKARALLEAKTEADSDKAFDDIMREGPLLMRRGTLDSVQKEVFFARKSKRNLLKSARDARKSSEEADFLIDNSLRRLTVTTLAVSKMSDRCRNARTGNFVKGSSEHANWAALRQHTSDIMQKFRKEQFRKQVEQTKNVLNKSEEKQPEEKQVDESFVRRATIN